jgi:hypothetical protein
MGLKQNFNGFLDYYNFCTNLTVWVLSVCYRDAQT